MSDTFEHGLDALNRYLDGEDDQTNDLNIESVKGGKK
jgi:hypothetical protein